MRSSVLDVLEYGDDGKLFWMCWCPGDPVPPSGDGRCVKSDSAARDDGIVLNFSIACDFVDQRHPADHPPNS